MFFVIKMQRRVMSADNNNNQIFIICLGQGEKMRTGPCPTSAEQVPKRNANFYENDNVYVIGNWQVLPSLTIITYYKRTKVIPFARIMLKIIDVVDSEIRGQRNIFNSDMVMTSAYEFVQSMQILTYDGFKLSM